jgi:hypothetical protein
MYLFGGFVLSLFCAPFWFLTAYVYLSCFTLRAGFMSGDLRTKSVFSGVWVTALWISFYLASKSVDQLYDALPPRSGGCFVATAAAKGHPCFVGSHIATNSAGKAVPITQQLVALKTFENLVEARRPRAHRALRFFYNRIGPPLAACIVHPLLADFAYLLLKPAEWFARVFLSGNCSPETHFPGRDAKSPRQVSCRATD